ncbi:ABC transporter permease [Oceanicella sp. SM1341]|uniref:ABC transporter permease n=1 Tax=Oceanicella sp. SM1341 TaxID=1548889 RepID=UPI000E54ED93|nr:ABC transporter permease [Oceanicella sp. SM1341]
MRFDLVFEHWDLFARGVVTTLELVALSLAVGFCIALPCGLALARGHRSARLIRAYVYVFRGTPLLVQTYLFYYGLGVTLGQYDWVRDSLFWPFLRDAWWIALLVFSLNSGAYATEIIRGAVITIPRGELEAARALGLSDRQVDFLVLIPSALRRALPQYGNEVVFMLHGSVVAGVITIQDIFGVTQTFRARYYVAYEGFLTAAALYMAITFVIVLIFRQLEKRYLAHLGLSR